MPDIFFPTQNLSIKELFAKDSSLPAHLPLNNSLQCDALTANMPYCLAEKKLHPESRIITHTLSNMSEASRNNLMCTIDTAGDFTTTLAAFYDRHLAFLTLPNATSVVGAVATASEIRLNEFQSALLDYQKALEALHRQKAGSPANGQLKSRVRQTYETLQLRYRAELNNVAAPGAMGKNRGNALSSADRGISLAQRRGRGRGRGINIASNTQALQISRLATGISYAGKGLIVLDAGIRTTGVYTTYKQGGDWQREAAIQTTSFGLAGATGLVTGEAVVMGLTAIGLGLTPVGWVILISLGAAAGFGAAFYADAKVKDGIATIYDSGLTR